MLAVFIALLEVGIVILVALLCYRIHNLYTSDKSNNQDKLESIIDRLISGEVSRNDEYKIKMDSLKKSQIFAGVQLLEIKRNHGDLQQEKLSWLREAVSLYLIGAIDFIGKQAQCGVKSRKELICLVLKSNLNLSTESTNNYYQEALERKLSSDNDLMVRAGAKAANSWLIKKNVPTEVTLKNQLCAWGVFA